MINDYIYLSIIFVLLFSLSSPNIVYFIHKKWFVWRKDKESEDKSRQLHDETIDNT